MKRTLFVIIAIVTAGACLAASPEQSKQFISPVYTIDKIYHSMEGPSSVERVYLGDPAAPAELLWVTGIRTEMVDADGATPQLPELMCHVNVDLDPARHQALFGFRRATAARLMTLSQGMLTAKVPAGFGFPLASNEPLLLFTQVLNLNIQKPQNLKVRHRVTIDYIRAFPHILGADGNRVLFRQFIADMEVGNGLPDDSAEPEIRLRWSDDRGRSWGNYIQGSLGKVGEYLTSIQFQRLGYARDRVFELSWSAPVKTALNGAWVDVSRART